jgi:hypothetical protein
MKIPHGLYGLSAHDQHRLEADVRYLIEAGPRAAAEFLLLACERRFDRADTLAELDAWREGLPAKAVPRICELYGIRPNAVGAVPR